VAANYLPHIKSDDRIAFKEPTTSLTSIIELEDSHTGEALYSKLIDEFFSLSPLLEINCIGIACDEGSSMSSNKKVWQEDFLEITHTSVFQIFYSEICGC